MRAGDTIPIFQGLAGPRGGLVHADSQAQADEPRASLRRRIPTSRRSRRPTPEKSLVEGLKKSGGRNTHGRKTSRHRGGGAKRLYRKIDFKRRKDGMPAKVAAIEYDPNRTAYIALLHYADGVKSYILAPGAPAGRRDGDVAARAPRSRSATACRWRSMPVGTVVHNVELQPGRGGQIGALRRRRRSS